MPTTTHSISLAWQAPSSGPAPTSYDIDRSPNGQPGTWTALANVPATQLTYTDANLPKSTTYFYTIASKNADGYGPISNVVSATTLADIPNAAENLTVTGTT